MLKETLSFLAGDRWSMDITHERYLLKASQFYFGQGFWEFWEFSRIELLRGQ